MRMDPREQVPARRRHPGEQRLHQVRQRRARAILRLRSLRSLCSPRHWRLLGPGIGDRLSWSTRFSRRPGSRRYSVLKFNRDRDISRASLVAFLVAASLFVGGCSGNLSGDFYYTTRGGDVKRLADREIALAKASDQFDAEWRKAVTGFQAALQVAYESKDTGSQALQDPAVKEWTAHALKRIAWGEVKIGTILPVRVSGPARVPATHSMSSSRFILSRAITKARSCVQRPRSAAVTRSTS